MSATDLVVVFSAAVLAIAAGVYSIGAGFHLGYWLSGLLFGGCVAYARVRGRKPRR